MEEFLQQVWKHKCQNSLNYQIGLDFQHASSDLTSRGSQTTETFLHRPTVNKASQVELQHMKVGMTAISEMKSVACGPDEPIYFINKKFSFQTLMSIQKKRKLSLMQRSGKS
ncbi:hypothetical protein CHS0354_016256 [Potamilus streckersoni]|uniref:Uncharacterized protein n=1 Tax=Potamilus streckersoni TaxID=2493646 RepID=A0AAE0VLM1_9BIVA|nr:hypothetical protein CHS0354_016256 [Potamilus streckersoni]